MNNAAFRNFLKEDSRTIAKEAVAQEFKERQKSKSKRSGGGGDYDADESDDEAPRADGAGDDPGSGSKEPPKKKVYRKGKEVVAPSGSSSSGQGAAAGYRDRAKERRDGSNTDYKAADALLLSLKAAQQGGGGVVGMGGLAQHTHGVEGENLVELTKYLGGEEEYTHLVKGLDFKLVEKVRREEMLEQQSLEDGGKQADRQSNDDDLERAFRSSTASSASTSTSTVTTLTPRSILQCLSVATTQIARLLSTPPRINEANVSPFPPLVLPHISNLAITPLQKSIALYLLSQCPTTAASRQPTLNYSQAPAPPPALSPAAQSLHRSSYVMSSCVPPLPGSKAPRSCLSTKSSLAVRGRASWTTPRLTVLSLADHTAEVEKRLERADGLRRAMAQRASRPPTSSLSDGGFNDATEAQSGGGAPRGGEDGATVVPMQEGRGDDYDEEWEDDAADDLKGFGGRMWWGDDTLLRRIAEALKGNAGRAESGSTAGGKSKESKKKDKKAGREASKEPGSGDGEVAALDPTVAAVTAASAPPKNDDDDDIFAGAGAYVPGLAAAAAAADDAAAPSSAVSASALFQPRTGDAGAGGLGLFETDSSRKTKESTAADVSKAQMSFRHDDEEEDDDDRGGVETYSSGKAGRSVSAAESGMSRKERRKAAAGGGKIERDILGVGLTTGVAGKKPKATAPGYMVTGGEAEVGYGEEIDVNFDNEELEPDPEDGKQKKKKSSKEEEKKV